MEIVMDIGFLIAISVGLYSIPVAILLGPVLPFRWKKDEWSGTDLALLFLATVGVDATALTETGAGLGQLFAAHELAGCGAALVGWFRGALLRVLPRKRFSLYWALLLSLVGVVSFFLAPRGGC